MTDGPTNRLTDRLACGLTDGLVAGAVAAVLSGLPSTVHALLARSDVLEATRAAGSILVGPDHSSPALVIAAVPVHGALSLGWGAVLGLALPPEHELTSGALAGLGIAALDLGGFGRRFPRIKALPPVPQILDHVAFGVIAGWVVRERRRRRGHGGGTGERRAPGHGRGPRPSRASPPG